MGKYSASDNYYDILNLRSDCNDKDIKTAYVILSKKFHPDVKGVHSGVQQTARFQKISEAYQTLSKPKLRMEYDNNLKKAAQSVRAYETASATENEFHRPWEIKPDYDPNPGPYYGIKGLNKTTNSKVAFVLLALGILGGLLGFASVRHSFSLNQKRLDDISARASEHHQKIRSDAEKYSKNEQLRRVIDRIANKAER